MKKVFSILLAAMLLVSLTGAALAQETTITFAFWDTNQEPGMSAIAAAYMEKHPEVKIEIQVTPWLETTIALTQNLDRSLISGQELVHDFDRSLIGDREHLPVRGNVSSVRYL